ncbi:MAG: DNA-binding transcriptional regulator Lrp family [Candidatus Methanohalarchaeum thermophilum]|uniref:DNA-binding transcriptional regulator Lrp family n=1 Tax=Methanohalarchaeum thermophilum TaxID=1903181 RepID=A0A1Q6DS99_METT1|nr:MAG: DNA-binding transcriptional regulator Lrp family [Candidatus Methanohalarchaeum thermophilum]
MDEKDRKIIKLLQENSRRPFTEIAEKLDVSEATIRKRVQELEKEGIIQKYTLKVKPEKLGYDAVTLLGLDVEPEKLLRVTETIKSMKEVKNVSICTGDHMVMAKIWANDNEHLNEIISKKIGKIEGVKDLCPAIIMEEVTEEKNNHSKT